MRFMYQYPDLTGLEGDMLDSGPVAELARAAEDAGWDGFAFTEHPAPGLRWSRIWHGTAWRRIHQAETCRALGNCRDSRLQVSGGSLRCPLVANG